MELFLVEFIFGPETPREDAKLYEIKNFIEKYFPCTETKAEEEEKEAEAEAEAKGAQDGPETKAKKEAKAEAKAKKEAAKAKKEAAEAEKKAEVEAKENVTNVYYVYLYSSSLDSAPSLTKTKKDIVGVTAVKIRTGHVHISLIVIAPAWRRRGLATYALTHVIKSTASLRDSGSVLTVSVTFEDLHLMQFYKKYGFSISHFDTASGLFTLTFLT